MIRIKKRLKNGDEVVKNYLLVAERIRMFRDKYPIESGWALTTEITFNDERSVFVTCKIIDPQGRVIATGHAEEIRGSSIINETNPVENAETSAIGRALAAAGFVGDGDIASAEEIALALIKEAGKMGAGGVAQADHAEAKPKVGETAPEKEPGNGSEKYTPPAIPGISYEVKDKWLVAKGDTYSNRSILEQAGFQYESSMKSWCRPLH